MAKNLQFFRVRRLQFYQIRQGFFVADFTPLGQKNKNDRFLLASFGGYLQKSLRRIRLPSNDCKVNSGANSPENRFRLPFGANHTR